MECISSDTNVWIDFSLIGCTELPFQLPYTYLMNTDAIHYELLVPSGLWRELLDYGLVGVELTIEEFELAEEYGKAYKRLSNYDCIALAIAKERRIKLLTGDLYLRQAASDANVEVMGTLGILDQLLEGERIDEAKYVSCLMALKHHNGSKIRLPSHEINRRLSRFNKSESMM